MTQIKKYLLDGEPVTTSQLIKAAEIIDVWFSNDWLKSTSKAAAILRENGQDVREN